MELFIDSANLDEIREVNSWGIIDGVTTNPSLMAKSGGVTVADVIRDVCNIVNGDISAEVLGETAEEMLEEGRKLSEIHENVVVKLPLTIEGIKACKKFSERGIKTNVTLVFSANQALLAAKAGATYVSPFIGRLDDIGHDGMNLIEEIRTVFDNYGYTTKILAASVRHPEHMRDAAIVGSDVATLPYKVLKALYAHPLTEKGLSSFIEDFKKSDIKLF